ncbi:hypothetical protein AAXE64_27555 [Priestia megaterium]|uniref:hypothetical protein n=1 Tax=Priestia megaterium TaxID=1404 RepID=UPI003D06334C
MDRKSYQKLRLGEFNAFDTERTLRENIYDLEEENLRIKQMILDMVEQKIPVPIILGWMRQMEDNAAEIVFITSLAQHDLNTYNFSSSTFYRKGRDEE